ncbi:MAG: hypothetical protein M1838_002859 [Thelocarpon superellum]|nr:MAG: hypothetical protein M1838_002859 [Thelocarpon superellum]
MSNYSPPESNVTGSNPSPPYGVITDDDHGPYVAIAAYIAMSFMVVIVISRGLTLLMTNRPLVHHDFLAPLMTNNYTSQIMYTIVIVMAKMSLLLFVARLTPSAATLRQCRMVMAVICLWGAAAVFALAFQCKLPTPWDFEPGRCIDQVRVLLLAYEPGRRKLNSSQAGLYYANGAISILTDAFIIVLPITIVWSLRINNQERSVIIFMFAMRAFVIVTSIVRLAYLSSYLSSSDQTFDNVNFSICTQIDMNLSIVTACLPLLKPFLDKIPSGVMDIRHAFLVGNSEVYYSDPNNSRTAQLGAHSKVRNENFAMADIAKRHDSDTALTEEGIRQTTELRVEFMEGAPSDKTGST